MERDWITKFKLSQEVVVLDRAQRLVLFTGEVVGITRDAKDGVYVYRVWTWAEDKVRGWYAEQFLVALADMEPTWHD